MESVTSWCSEALCVPDSSRLVGTRLPERQEKEGIVPEHQEKEGVIFLNFLGGKK